MTTPSIISRFQEAAQSAEAQLDINYVNVMAHAEQHWPTNWTWDELLLRVQRMQGVPDAADAADLYFIKAAATHSRLCPAAFIPGVQWSARGLPELTRLQHQHVAFAQAAAEMFDDRAHGALLRREHVKRMRHLLGGIRLAARSATEPVRPRREDRRVSYLATV